MPYGLDGHRNPIFLISTMAMHTQNLKADPRSSLLVTHSAVGIVQHMNADHGDALILLAQAFAGIEAQEAVMTSVDRLGFHVRLKTQEGMRGARIAFLREVSSPAEAREVLVEMTAQARRS
jgi:putative heme iron utilization protein